MARLTDGGRRVRLLLNHLLDEVIGGLVVAPTPHTFDFHRVLTRHHTSLLRLLALHGDPEAAPSIDN